MGFVALQVVKLLKLEDFGCRAGTRGGQDKPLPITAFHVEAYKETTNVIWRLIRYLVPYESRTVAKFCDCVGPDGMCFVWDCCFGLMGLEVL